MKALAGLAALACAAGCNGTASPRLPGASITPHLAARVAPAACGLDVAMFGSTTPSIRYRYTYDARGELVHATGSYATGPDDVVDYDWDHLGHLTHMLETRAWGDVRSETTAEYDTLGDLIDYTWSEAASDGSDQERYAYAALTDAGLPAREVVSQPGQPDVGYTLDYDASERIAHAVQDGGPTTTYTYDDRATRTTTIDTGDGAFHGVIVYDDDDHELSETWGGSDPAAIASDDRYDWSGDRLLSVTHRSGTSDAPRDLQLVEVDTLRYDCAAARTR